MKASLEEIRKGLIGTWKLISYESKPAGLDGPIKYPMGKDVQGYIMYSFDGDMSAQLMTPGSKHYTVEDVTSPITEEAASAASHYLAYSGPFELCMLDGKPTLKHHTDVSLIQNWAGSHQKRSCDLRGDELILSPVEPWVVKGELVDQVLRWKRTVPL